MGLGVLGRGVGDVDFLARCGAEVIVTDRKTESELAASVVRLKQYPNVTFHLGGSLPSATALGFSKTEYRQENLGDHREEDFTSCDMVLKAAGVPLDSPYIVAAHGAGVPVYMSTALFAKYVMEEGATIVGVTGTRGKSTTTQMIYHGLKLAGKIVFLGGNVRGVSTLALLPEVEPRDIVVLELDSWQLQGFGDLKISPQIAVFTNLLPDHQNYYPDMDAYFADKANIFASQKDGDMLICGKSVEERIKAARPAVAPHVPPAIPTDWTVQIPGEHNRQNAALAAEALRALQLSEEEIRAGLESFEGVEGRLQFVREINGVKIYNDNNATTPDATIAALCALAPNVGLTKSHIILIMGGADKGLNMEELLSEVRSRCKKVILLAGTGTDRIKNELPDASIFDSLQKAIDSAIGEPQPGDIILFSPAFASFGMFKNEYERNDEFLRIVEKL